MLTSGEQQELHQIEEGLRDADRGFAWRLALLQGVLRWVGPGRQAYLSALAALAATLLRLAAAAGRLLMACAQVPGAASGAMMASQDMEAVMGQLRWR